MKIKNAVSLFLVAMSISTCVILVTASTSWGAPIASRLAHWAAIVPVERFDARLNRELDALLYPDTRPLMHAVVMGQIAEHARAVRLASLRDPDIRGWQVPLPQSTFEDRDLPPRIALGRLPGDGMPPILAEDTTRLAARSGWLASLVILVSAFVLVIVRRG
ncbi:MAG: hypothetical protein R3E83_03885 [Burkholderiaceae bacterium]